MLDASKSIITNRMLNILETLILVNDGSSDKSGEICQEYAQQDCRITVIYQSNGGPGKARNTGINACKTPWFTFVDADDKLLPTYLANFHVENCKNETILSCQGLKRVDLQGHQLGRNIVLTTQFMPMKIF